MRIVFMGSAELAIPSLRAILESENNTLVGVVSQPDRPAGRKRVPTPSPLKAFAVEQGTPVITPEKLGDPASMEALSALQPDLFVVVAYGQYIPTRVIDLAPHKAINLHPSLLPKYRGSAPIQWAIANGDTQTGVSIITVDKKMDAGDILQQKTYPIHSDDTSLTLHKKLADFGAELLLEVLDDICNNTVSSMPQDETQVVEIRKLNKADGQIDWMQSAFDIQNRIRAFDPWPGSFCTLPNGEILKVWSAKIEEGKGRPGEILDDQLLVATADKALRLTEIQPSGKKKDAFRILSQWPPAPFIGIYYVKIRRAILISMLIGVGIVFTIIKVGKLNQQQQFAKQEKWVEIQQKAVLDSMGIKTVDLGKGVMMEFLPIPLGNFKMGSDRVALDELPIHKVTFLKPFWMAKTEVTIEQWKRFLEETESISGTDWSSLDCPLKRSDHSFSLSHNDFGMEWNQPMIEIDWNASVEFCTWLTKKARQSLDFPKNFEVTLPTEAQWEYACRAGTTTKYFWGDHFEEGICNAENGRKGSNKYQCEYFISRGMPVGSTMKVGSFKPNAWGLHDMHGNVWEWCLDDLHGSYTGAPMDGSRWGDGSVPFRVKRGGGGGNTLGGCRSANRYGASPENTSSSIGFRAIIQGCL